MWLVPHQNFCAAGKGRGPSWQLPLWLPSLAHRNGQAASCTLDPSKGMLFMRVWAPSCSVRPQKGTETACGCGELHDARLLRGLERGTENRCPTVQKRPLFNTSASAQDSLKANTGCTSPCPEDVLGNSPTRCHRHSPYSPPSVFHL